MGEQARGRTTKALGTPPGGTGIPRRQPQSEHGSRVVAKLSAGSSFGVAEDDRLGPNHLGVFGLSHVGPWSGQAPGRPAPAARVVPEGPPPRRTMSACR